MTSQATNPPLGDGGFPTPPAQKVSMSLKDALAFASKELAAGRFGKAEDLFGQLHRAFPKSFVAAFNLCYAMHRLGKNADALTVAERVRQLEPNNGKGLHLYAYILSALGRHQEAVPIFQQALALVPSLQEGWCNLGKSCTHAGRVDLAVESFERLVDLAPTFDVTLFEFKTRNSDLLANATNVITRLLDSRPDSVLAMSNLAKILIRQDRLGEARTRLEKAMALRPDHPVLHCSLAAVLAQEGSWQEALVHFDRTLELQPENPMAHFFRGIVLMHLGNLRDGWQEYEWRWRWEGFPDRGLRARFENESWDGRPLNGQRILVHFEQGLGDTMHFVRYVPMVATRGGRAVLEVPPSLVRLFKRVQGVADVLPTGTKLGQVDNHVSLMDLPRVMGTDLQNIPADVPYLSPYPLDEECWRQRLGGEKRFKVGLVWGGSATNALDAHRSMDVKLLQKLLAIDDIAFYSFQLGREGEFEQLPQGMAVDLAPYLKDFADTAAAVSQMDLIISVDTAMIHLAGAMGKPVWMLLYYISEWRWMAEREDSPWYPTLRIFRQSQRGRWDDVVDRVAEALRTHVAARH